MPTQHYRVRIACAPSVVWHEMLGREGYEDWTSAFAEGSTYEGSWETGARIRFLSPSGGGVVSEIAECRPHQFLSVRHLGLIANGVEDFESEAVKAWAPAYENYTFDADGDGTELVVDLDVSPGEVDMMNAMWAKGLARLKARCERAPA